MFILLVKHNILFSPLLLNLKTYTLNTSSCFVYCSNEGGFKPLNKRKQTHPRKYITPEKRVKNTESSETLRESNTERESTLLTKPNIYTTNTFSSQTRMYGLSNTIPNINRSIQENRMSSLSLSKKLGIKQTKKLPHAIFFDDTRRLEHNPPPKDFAKKNFLITHVIDTENKVVSSVNDEFFPFKIDNDPDVTSESANETFTVYYKKSFSIKSPKKFLIILQMKIMKNILIQSKHLIF
ncbi:hypothetical protein CDIK_2255 [Cucumispora dikerogammari]|nr:hypothetical protein CDIK_2255 [Cucumispora dikerogammari]